MSSSTHDFWNSRYAAAGFAYGTAPNDFLAGAAARLPAGGTVLCLAEGEGRNAVWLAQQGYRVTAVDASAVGLAKARALAAERGVAIATICADLTDFAIVPAAWDGIVSIFCHLPPPLRLAVHRACVAGLAPGGVLLLEGYTPRQLAYRTGGPPQLELLYEAETLRDDFTGLELELLQEVVREVREGSCHTGSGAVVRVVARKG